MIPQLSIRKSGPASMLAHKSTSANLAFYAEGAEPLDYRLLGNHNYVSPQEDTVI